MKPDRRKKDRHPSWSWIENIDFLTFLDSWNLTVTNPAKDSSKAGDKRGPLTPGLTPGKRSKTSTHLFVVDGPTTIEEMGFTSQEVDIMWGVWASLHKR